MKDLKTDRQHTGKLSRRAMAAVELMLRGMSDFGRVGAAVGLPIGEVRQLEAADDPRVRKLILEGLPEDFVFRLRIAIVCPGCNCRIYLVPCMTCRVSRPNSAKSTVDSADTH